MLLRILGLFLHYCIDVAQVASLLVIVKTVAENEVVRNLHCHVLDVKGHLQTFRLEQERAYMHSLRLLFLKHIEKSLHCKTRLDDVLHNDDSASLDVLVQSDKLLYVAR